MLILQIQSYQKQSPNQTSTLTLDQGSITIGRDITNDWSLSDPDRVLSKRHCRIECRDGSYFLTDTSTNGVFVNAAANAVGRDNSVSINPGDMIRIGDYEIGASIENVQPSPVQPVSPVSPVVGDGDGGGEEAELDAAAAPEDVAGGVTAGARGMAAAHLRHWFFGCSRSLGSRHTPHSLLGSAVALGQRKPELPACRDVWPTTATRPV